MPPNERLMANLKVNGHSSMVWYWFGDPMVPRSIPLLVRKFLLLSLLIWKGGFEILPNNTWDLLKKAYGTSKKLRFQFRGQLNKPFSEPTYLYTNLITGHQSWPSKKFGSEAIVLQLMSWNSTNRAGTSQKVTDEILRDGQTNLNQTLKFPRDLL